MVDVNTKTTVSKIVDENGVSKADRDARYYK